MFVREVNINGNLYKRKYGDFKALQSEKEVNKSKEIVKKIIFDEEIYPGDDSRDGIDDDTVALRWVKLHKFNKNLSGKKDFKSSIRAIKSYFTNLGDRYSIFVDLPENVCIKIVLKKKQFKSCALKRDYFLEPALPPKQLHHKFKVYECIPDNKLERVLKMYISKRGSKGELTWIQKGTHLSGSRVFDIYSQLDKILGVKEMILYDDANRELINPNTNLVAAKLPLRPLSALSSKDARGLSWYEERGFLAANCSDFPTTAGNITQTYDSYRKAITTIRKTKLNDLNTILRGYKKNRLMMDDLRKKYLPKRKTNATIHDLFKAMNDQAHSKSGDEQFVIQKEMADVLNQVISYWQPKKILPKQKPFFDALRILHEGGICSKFN